LYCSVAQLSFVAVHQGGVTIREKRTLPYLYSIYAQDDKVAEARPLTCTGIGLE
jgi:hypothetical protein